VEKLTLDQIRELYFQHLRFKNYAESTLSSTGRDMRNFYRFLRLQGITDIEIVGHHIIEAYKRYLSGYEYINTKGESKKYAKRYITDKLIAVSQFFKFLVREDIVMTNPVDEIKIPRFPDPIPRGIMTREEVKRVLNTCNLKTPEGYRDRTILEVFYSAGVRNIELCRLKVSDLDLENYLLTVIEGKGKKDRVVPLNHSCTRFLKRYIKEFRPVLLQRDSMRVKHRAADDGTLFVGKWGATLDTWRVDIIVGRCVRQAGLDKHITPHCFRHTVATHMLQNGMDIRYVQEFLGHSNIQSTQRYTRVDVGELREKFKDHRPKRKRKIPRFEEGEHGRY